MKYYDYKNEIYIESKETYKSLSFLYNTCIGRTLLKILTSKFIAKIMASYFNSFISKFTINHFIKKNDIDMSMYEKQKYKSFNDFFIRKIKEDKIEVDEGLVSVCDGKLSAYKIDDNSCFKIKNSLYTPNELSQENMSNFNGGYALIYRLTPDDYHHYIYFDEGKVLRRKKINGLLHTVQPIAFKRYKVFTENAREVTLMDTKNYGKVLYIEVGALLIGKITNNDFMEFNKGEEKGYFEFGGSTIILLFEKDKIKLNEKIIQNTKNGIETIVKVGQNIE